MVKSSIKQIDMFAPASIAGELMLKQGNLADAMPLILAHHYTKRRTADPMFTLCWERNNSIEAVAVFTSPANKYFGEGAVELSRLVRLPTLDRPLSQFLALCLSWLKQNSELKYCLSYADSGAGHHGGIYQASNFIHVAVSKGHAMYRCKTSGDVVSARARDQRRRVMKDNCERISSASKYLYVFPLNERRRKLLERFKWTALPFPKPAHSQREIA